MNYRLCKYTCSLTGKTYSKLVWAGSRRKNDNRY